MASLMKSVTLKSPAKLNLFLRVLCRRADGYHDLVTVFHRLSLADTIKIKKAPVYSLRCSNPALPTGGDNLITKAWRLLKKRFPGLGPVRVYLKKTIPVGAGLGGGSSNAAAFLLGMKRLYGLRISKKELLELGGKLGADVPFFIHNINQAIGIGVGDVIQSKPAKTRQWFVLLISKRPLWTKEVYRKLSRPLPEVSLTKLSHAAILLCNFLDKKKLGPVAKLLQNDLESSAFLLRPSLQGIIRKVTKLGVPTVRMTGSGPTVFALVKSLREANRLARNLRSGFPSLKIVVCHTQ